MSSRGSEPLVEVVCEECDGHGRINTYAGYTSVECPCCFGAGWVHVTQAEFDADHYTRWEGR